MKLKHIATIGLALAPTVAFAGPAINVAITVENMMDKF